MADSKISQLTSLTTTAAEDLLPVVDNPNGTPVNKKITIKNFFGAIPANTLFSGAKNVINSANTVATGNVTLTGTLTANVVKVTFGSTPASNNATTASMIRGELRFTNTHLYLAISNSIVRRIALSDWNS